MEESFGAQYALQIALQTLRERCQQFQQRIATLEEENLNLQSKIIVKVDATDTSLPEIDSLKQQISQLTEQNLQLTSNVLMVSAENRQLWSRLSKLTQVNESLGSGLHKINDTLSQHNAVPQNAHATLIRSKTFTQSEPHLKLVPKNVTDENNRISLELEDISLKLICNIAKEKSELELQCSQMTELQNSEFINTFAFGYSPDEIDGPVIDEFDQYLMNLKNIKHLLLQEKEKLQRNLSNLATLPIECKCKIHKPHMKMVSTFAQTNMDILEDECEEPISSLDGNILNKSSECDKICPMCSKIFKSNIKFDVFQDHVESHFMSEADNFDMIP